MFYFPNHRIKITGYLFRSYNAGLYPRSWRVECSNNNQDWVIIDERVNDKRFTAKSYQHTFRISTPHDIFFRTVRITQTEKNAIQTTILKFALLNLVVNLLPTWISNDQKLIP